jgi:hypothetical protein
MEAAIVAIFVVLAIEGYFLYSFYAKPSPDDTSASSGSTPKEKVAAHTREHAEHTQGQTAQSLMDEAEYVSRVGDIQDGAVETFLDSHDRLLHYDALTADDVQRMQTDQGALQEYTDQVDNLDPPEKYKEQYEAFRSAIDELYGASRLAYDLAADPTTATQSGFDEYDRRVSDAADILQTSNRILGRDYKSIEGVQEVSPT